MKTIGKRISELRKKYKMTQEDLATKMNVSPQAVSKWENDLSIPDITILIELSELFHVSLDYLIKEKEEKIKVIPIEERKPLEQLFLKIRVLSVGGDKVKLNLPFIFVKTALEAGILIPSIQKNKYLKDIDLKMIITMIESGAIGKIVEVESAAGDLIEISVE